jgi:hypothetical protein
MLGFGFPLLVRQQQQQQHALKPSAQAANWRALHRTVHCHRSTSAARKSLPRITPLEPMMRMKGTKNRAFYDEDDGEWIGSELDQLWRPSAAPARYPNAPPQDESATIHGSAGPHASFPTTAANSSQALTDSPPDAPHYAEQSSTPESASQPVYEEVPAQETDPIQPPVSASASAATSNTDPSLDSPESKTEDADEYVGPLLDPDSVYLQCPECAMCYQVEASLFETARICRCTQCLHEFVASAMDLISADTLVSDRPTMGVRPLPRIEATARAEARLKPVRKVIADALAAEAARATKADADTFSAGNAYIDVMLYVGNLAPMVTESDLIAAFSPYGDLLSCRIIRDRQRGHSLGYGFVRFTSKADARVALNQLQGTCIMGQEISIGYARGTVQRDAADPRRPFLDKSAGREGRFQQEDWRRFRSPEGRPGEGTQAALRPRPENSNATTRQRVDLASRRAASPRSRWTDRHERAHSPDQDERLHDSSETEPVDDQE